MSVESAATIAVVAGAVAVVAVILAAVALLRLRRLRAAQRVVLGEGETRDLVSQAAELELAFADAIQRTADSVAQVAARLAVAEAHLDRAIASHSVVRYDAYGEMSGRQSTSLAAIDDGDSGLVMTTIVRRDSARLYVKRLVAGEADIELSPEEQEAVAAARRGRAAEPAL